MLSCPTPLLEYVMWKGIVLSLAAFFVAIGTEPLASAQGTYTNIDVPGAFTYAYGINNAGEVVGSYITDAFHGFIFSGGTHTTLDHAADTIVIGINDKGQVVGVASGGFLYDRTTGTFTNVLYQGLTVNSAVAINNRGTIVGFTIDGDAFELNALGRGTIIKLPNATSVGASGISDSGLIVGWYGVRGGDLANFEFRPGRFRQVNIPGAPAAVVYAINPSGTALAGTFLPGAPTDSFLYRNGTVYTVAYPGARATYAYGVNDAGQISGTYYTETDGPHGFVWTPPVEAAKK